MKEANKIAKYLTDISGVNVFENSRKRKNVEVRSLLTFILRNQFNMSYHGIKRFYESNDKDYDHATAIHSLKTFEVNRRYNPKLDEWLNDIQHLLIDKAEIKRGLLKHKIEYLYKKDVDKLLKITNDMKLKELNGERQTKEKAPTNI